MLQLSANQEMRLCHEFLGSSQAQLALMMGTTQTSVARWESAISPISPMTISHVRVMVALRVKEEVQKLFARLVPELALCDFEGLYALSSVQFTTDSVGNLYIGMVEIMGYRKHLLYIRLDDGQWYGLDRENNALKVDKDFLRAVRMTGRLRAESFGEAAPTKDDPRVQRERIRKLASEVFPDFVVVFDDSQPFTWIRFRFDERTLGKVMGTPSGHFHVSEIADWPDEKLIRYMEALVPSFVR